MNEATFNDFRQQIDQFMGHHPQSPLPYQDKATFTGLDYYGYNAALAQTLPVTLLPEDEPLITMEATGGATRLHRRWGQISITVAGKPTTVTIYSDPSGAALFLPFRDKTSGNETYGAGRYLDSHRPGLALVSSSEIEIDFNFAYNPFCAYDESFSCPLPPVENWLQVPIEAGEKKFK